MWLGLKWSEDTWLDHHTQCDTFLTSHSSLKNRMKTIRPPSNRNINIHVSVKKMSSQMSFPPRGHLVIMIYWPESVFPKCQTRILILDRSYLLFNAMTSWGGFSPNACLFNYTCTSVSCQCISSSNMAWNCNMFFFFLLLFLFFCELVYC